MIAETFLTTGSWRGGDTVGADREFVWVLDPIDGTRAFIGGFPLFTNLARCTSANPFSAASAPRRRANGGWGRRWARAGPPSAVRHWATARRRR